MREEIIDIGKRTCHIITTDSEPLCVLVKPLCSFERRLLLHECALIEQEAGKGFVMFTFEVEEAELWKDRVGELLAYIENSLIAAIEARYAHLPLVVGGSRSEDFSPSGRPPKRPFSMPWLRVRPRCGCKGGKNTTKPTRRRRNTSI